MSIIHVQRQCWQRWPRVLIAEKSNNDGTREERRYVPEGGTRDEWNAEVRETLHKFEAARKELDARLHEESELPNLRAEIDGLEWQAEELESALKRACKHFADTSCTCPYDMFDFRAKNCDDECKDDYADCWRIYFEEER